MRARGVALVLLVAGCGDQRGATALYDQDAVAGGDFFAAPWPSDARVKDGKIDLGGFYNPGGAIGSYLAAVSSENLGGFGSASAIYFRFDAPLDPSRLPASPGDTLGDNATMFVVDVTPQSPTYGKRSPVRVRFSTDQGLYIGSNWLALLPEPGFPLRPKTTYAAVVTDGTTAADGGSVHRDGRFDPATALGPAIAGALGVDTGHVAIATAFTTQDSTTVMQQLRDAVYAQAPAPTTSDLAYAAAKKGFYDAFVGTYPSPNFQEGDPPYKASGGRIHVGSDGKPQVVRTEQLRFAMTIPQAQMPPDGWPVVLYAHGTGGDYESFISDGSATDAANVLDEDGNVIAHLAMISIDQVLHGPRDPTMSDPDLTFFNFNNLTAARDNAKQGALDDFQLVRFVEGFSTDTAPTTGQPIKFDKDRIYFKGHSQGGLTGPLFLAYEPKVKAAILSGAGADLILSLLNKTEPVDIPKVVSSVVGEDVDEFHPLLTLLQTYLESSDPGNYARLFFREPPAGVPVKSIYQSMGIVDHYTPVPNIKALALAMGVQPASPQVEPLDDLTLTALSWGDPPLQSNVAGGHASGVLCEYKVPLNNKGQPLYDGHFVVFDDPHAAIQANAFLGTHANTGIAQLLK